MLYSTIHVNFLFFFFLLRGSYCTRRNWILMLILVEYLKKNTRGRRMLCVSSAWTKLKRSKNSEGVRPSQVQVLYTEFRREER